MNLPQTSKAEKLIAKSLNKLGKITERVALDLQKKSRNIHPWLGLHELDIKLANAAPELLNKEIFFIEVGANDGISQSNTFFLEKIYGARGMLIEASPSRFEKCQMNRSHRNIFEHCALASDEYTATTMELIYSNLMTVSKNATEVIPSQHAANGLRHFRGQNYTFHAPVKTLNHLIQTNNIRKVDILSIDLEGYELEALKGARLETGIIKNILVECRDIETMKEFLETKNYRLKGKLSHHDYLFSLQPD